LQESASKLPDVAEVQFHVGMAYYMLGQDEPARAALQKAVDSAADFPNQDEARQRLALLAVDPTTATLAGRMQLQDFLRVRPDDPAALFRSAQLQERDGQIDQAVKTYEKVVNANLQYAPALRKLVLLYGKSETNDP